MKSYGIFSKLYLATCFFLTKIFFHRARLIRFPIFIKGKKNISLGKGFTTGINCRIDAFLDGKILIGENVQINDNVHIGSYQSIKIGDNVLIASKVFISDHNHGSYTEDNSSHPHTPPAKRSISSKPIVIKKNVWIGEFVSILPGVIVGEGSIIGSNSTVTKSIPPNTICVGSPAKPIKTYNFSNSRWESIKND